MTLIQSIQRFAARFLFRETDGSTAVIFALSLIPIMIVVGVSVDLNRAHSLRQKLYHAVDAGGLAAGKANSDDEAQLLQVATDFIKANLTDEEWSQVGDVALSLEDETINVTLTGKSKTAILGIVNIDYVPLNVDVAVVRETKKLEVALVLDNTGSMNSSGKIGALRDASEELVNILFGQETVHELLEVAVVPYVTAVNVRGSGFNSSWIDIHGQARHSGDNFSNTWEMLDEGKAYKKKDVKKGNVPSDSATFNIFGESVTLSPGGNVSHLALFEAMDVNWKGCVEMRAEPYDLTDEAPNPANPDTLFVPYLWPDEPSSGGDYHNNYLGSDNDYGDDNAERQRNVEKYLDVHHGDLSDPSVDETPSDTKGPNMSCGQPILPLTNDKSTILDEIDDMRAWNGSGTNGAAGLSWGWRVVSPGEPYTQGGAYDDDDVRKAIVLMTDGENQIWGGWNSHNKSNYSSYGYLSERRLDTDNKNTAKGKVNDKMTTLCNNIKAEGITLYTVTFRLNSNDLKTVFRNCATQPDYYFDSTSNGELEEHFKAIARSLTELRIAR